MVVTKLKNGPSRLAIANQKAASKHKVAEDDICLLELLNVKKQKTGSAPVVKAIGTSKLQILLDCGFSTGRELVRSWRARSSNCIDDKVAALIRHQQKIFDVINGNY